MAEANGMIASAVVIPEGAELPPPPSTSLKRRQSSISEDVSTKRARISPELSHGSHREGASHHSPINGSSSVPRLDANSRRKSILGKEEERKRGQRLFGVLLGTLSQSNSSSTAQKRRADIEKKQQAKLKLETQEHEDEKKRRADELLAARKKAQVVWDEETMHVRHANELAMANFLRTKAEPRLFYKPSDLRQSEKDLIKFQLEEVRVMVDQELEDFKKMHKAEDGEKKQESSVGMAQLDGAMSELVSTEAAATVGAEDSATQEAPASTSLPDTNDTNPGPVESPKGLTEDRTAKEEQDHEDVDWKGKTEAEENADDNEEVVVVAGEDAVMY